MSDQPTPPIRASGSQLTAWGFVWRNAAWGAVIGALTAIGWMVAIQDFWFAQFIVLGGAMLSCAWGAIASSSAWALGSLLTRFRGTAVAVVFVVTAMGVQILMLAIFVFPATDNPGVNLMWIYIAAANSTLGGLVAGLVFRYVR